MFHIGDRVIYGGMGVCDVADISTLQLDGVPRDRLYITFCVRSARPRALSMRPWKIPGSSCVPS